MVNWDEIEVMIGWITKGSMDRLPLRLLINSCNPSSLLSDLFPFRFFAVRVMGMFVNYITILGVDLSNIYEKDWKFPILVESRRNLWGVLKEYVWRLFEPKTNRIFFRAADTFSKHFPSNPLTKTSSLKIFSLISSGSELSKHFEMNFLSPVTFENTEVVYS